MKISGISAPLYFNGKNDYYYKKEMEDKSSTTLKLAIGTAVAAAGLLAVYYITRGKKIPKNEPTKQKTENNPVTDNIQEPIIKIKEINGIIEKTAKEILDKINPQIAEAINKYKLKTQNFSERLITILNNGKVKAEYKGKKDGKIAKQIVYFNPDGSIRRTITNFSNGNKIVKNLFIKDDKMFTKKMFINKEGKLTKTQNISMDLAINEGIPSGYISDIEIHENGKLSHKRTSQLSLDMKPERSTSDGKTVIYGYSSRKPGEVIAHAYMTDDNKYILKFLNNKQFEKEFDDLESIYKWARGNFVSTNR